MPNVSTPDNTFAAYRPLIQAFLKMSGPTLLSRFGAPVFAILRGIAAKNDSISPENALVALQLVSILYTLLAGTSQIATNALGPLTAKAFADAEKQLDESEAKNHREKIAVILWQTQLLGCITAIPAGLALLWADTFWKNAFGYSQEVCDMVRDYMRIAAISTIPLNTLNAQRILLPNIKRNFAGTVSNGTGLVVLVGSTLVVMYATNFGIIGVAGTPLIFSLFSNIANLGYFFSKDFRKIFNTWPLRLRSEWAQVKELLKGAATQSAIFFADTLANFSISTLIASKLGREVLVAYGTAGLLASIPIALINPTIAQGIGTLVGHTPQNLFNMRRVLFMGGAANAAISITLFIPAIVASKALLNLFLNTASPATNYALSIAPSLMAMMAANVALDSARQTLTNFLRNLGAHNLPAVINVFAGSGVSVLAAWLLTSQLEWGALGLAAGALIGNTVSTTILSGMTIFKTAKLPRPKIVDFEMQTLPAQTETAAAAPAPAEELNTPPQTQSSRAWLWGKCSSLFRRKATPLSVDVTEKNSDADRLLPNMSPSS